jgi:hypothetical protein
MSNTVDPTILKELGKNGNPQNSQQSQQNLQNNVDNNKNNSYINGKGEVDGSNTSIDDHPEGVDEKVMNLIENTFGGDPIKLAKSYSELQATYTEKNRELKKIKEPYERLNQILTQNPKLFDYIQRASNGENVENLLSSGGNQSGQSSTANKATQLDVSTDVDEKALIAAGYLDANELANLTDYEKQMKVLRATQRYLTNEIPKQITQKTLADIHSAQQQADQERTKQQTILENQRRYQEGIKDAALGGWDFTKEEHAQYLDELEEEIHGLRDPKNLNLLRTDAVEIALERISRKHGVKIKQTQPVGIVNQNQKNFNQTNINSRSTQDKQMNDAPKSILDQIIQRGMEQNRNRYGDYLKRYQG